MINFSKWSRLEYNDKTYTFKTIDEVIGFIKKVSGNTYSRDFVLEMLDANCFDINKWLNYYDLNMQDRTRVKNENIRNLELVKMYRESKNILKQNDVYKQVYNIGGNNVQLDPNKYIGICLLTSTYNAYPKMFDYNSKNVLGLIEELGSDNFDKPYKVVDKLNEKLDIGIDVFKYYMSNVPSDIDGKVHEIIDAGCPIIMSNADDSSGTGHTVTLVGYDRDWYYIIENDHRQFINLYIKAYMKKNDIDKYEDLKNAFKEDGKFLLVNKHMLFKTMDYIDLTYMNPQCKDNRNLRKIVYFTTINWNRYRQLRRYL